MSLSNHEVHAIMKCESCFFGDQEKLDEMKKHHNNGEWEKCSDVLGACTLPRQRNLEFPTKETIICRDHKEK